MRRPAALLVFALASFACTNEDIPADTSSESSSEAGESGSDEIETSAGETTQSETDTSNDVPDCTPGAFACVCGEGDTCSPDLTCKDGICTFGDCSNGYDGCPCAEGGVCNDGLFCVDGTCGCMPGSLGCGCMDASECGGGLACVDGECWLMSEYPNCGWLKDNGYYFCGSNIAHPDWPIDCPVGEYMNDLPCPAGLTFEGCCGVEGSTWWCQNGVIASMPCG
jgi:hypothetical protein